MRLYKDRIKLKIAGVMTVFDHPPFSLEYGVGGPIQHVLKPKTPKRNNRNEMTEMNERNETKQPKRT